MKKMNNTELRDDLIKTYKELSNGEIGLREARIKYSCAGKIIASAKLQLEYNAYTKSSKDFKIDFLE